MVDVELLENNLKNIIGDIVDKQRTPADEMELLVSLKNELEHESKSAVSIMRAAILARHLRTIDIAKTLGDMNWLHDPTVVITRDAMEMLEFLTNDLVCEYQKATETRRSILDRYLHSLEVAMTLAELRWLLHEEGYQLDTGEAVNGDT